MGKGFGIATTTPAGRPCLTQINNPEQGQCNQEKQWCWILPALLYPHHKWQVENVAPTDLGPSQVNPQAFGPLLGNVVPLQKPSSKTASPHSADLLSASVTSAGFNDVNQFLLLLTWKTQRGGS